MARLYLGKFQVDADCWNGESCFATFDTMFGLDPFVEGCDGSPGAEFPDPADGYAAWKNIEYCIMGACSK